MKVECLTVSACGAEAITGFIPLPTVEATPLGHEDNRNCKRSAFICVHSIKKISLLFCKIRQKIECSFLPSALISRSTIMNTLHTLKNTGFKTNQFGLRKRVHLGLILPSKFDCLFNPSLMDDLTQLMALFVSIIIFTFFFFLFFTLCMK